MLCVGELCVGWGSVCLLCVGEFCVGLEEGLYTVCGRVWYGFGEVSVYYVWECLVWVWMSDCELCVRQFGVGLGE